MTSCRRCKSVCGNNGPPKRSILLSFVFLLDIFILLFIDLIFAQFELHVSQLCVCYIIRFTIFYICNNFMSIVLYNVEFITMFLINHRFFFYRSEMKSVYELYREKKTTKTERRRGKNGNNKVFSR